jgi:hypothetical protein
MSQVMLDSFLLKFMQVKRRSTYLMTVEMSIFGSICLLVSMFWSPDGKSIQHNGFFYGWTPLTYVPVLLNAIGGILVGLITQLAGGVKKVCPEICSERSMSFQGRFLDCNVFHLFWHALSNGCH